MTEERSVRCQQCEVLNDPGTAFCTRCGASLRDFGGKPRFRKRRRLTANGAILGFIMLVLLVIVVMMFGVVIYRTSHPVVTVDPLAGRSGTTASTSTTLGEGSTSTTAADPSTATSLPVAPERPRAATESSALKATNARNYRATNLLDGNLETAWTEGADGPGLGEWVEFQFTLPLTLVRIEVANGYQLDESRFRSSARIKTVQLEYSDGETQLVDLLDTQEYQSIDALPVRTEWIKMTIVSVHPNYLWADASLSEVRFYGVVE